MKRIINKITTTLMTMIFALSLIVTPAFAEGANSANNSIQPEKGNLTIHKYLMDRLPNPGVSNDGNEVTNLPQGAVALQGIKFDIYEVILDKDDNYPVSGILDLVYVNKVLTGFKDAATPTKQDFNVDFVKTVTTDENGSALASNLKKAIYLVVEQTDDRVASPAEPFLVSVPMTNADGNGWLTDVHVYPKNESINIEKTPSGTSIVVGDTVTWDIKVSVPTGIGEYKKFDVIDQLDSALDYTNDSVVVTRLASKDATTGTTISAEGNYTISYENRKLTVSFTEAGRKALEGNKYISVKFKTTVNSTILDRESNVIENTPQLDFTNKFDENKTPSGEKTEIHTADIKITKVDKNTSAVLAGAKFKIASSEENAKKGNYLKIKDNVIYEYNNAPEGAVDYEVTTGEDGMAYFKGLEDYIEVNGVKTYKSYWLVETQAPNGYNLLNAPIKVEFTAANSIKDNAYTISTTVKNPKGFTLPATGGSGTILFSVAGTVLIGFAVILVMTSKKTVRTK